MNCGEDRLTVVVVSYNTRALLLECLTSIAGSSPDLEIVVVDNNSSDGSGDAVRQYFPQVKLTQNPTNVGFARACNRAIIATTSPLILLLNSDARLNSQALSALCDCMSSDRRCGAAACTIVDADGAVTPNTWHFLNPANQALELIGIRLASRLLSRTHRPVLDQGKCDNAIDWIDGACLMLRRSALEDVGLFDERFFMYSEDEDLCFRLKQRGWSVCFTARGSVTHCGGASAAQNRVESLARYYSSQMEFLRKNRSAFSEWLYTWAMRYVLIAKKLFGKQSSMAGFTASADEMLAALKRAAHRDKSPR
jgi:GT2 family glycosyltransferase